MFKILILLVSIGFSSVVFAQDCSEEMTTTGRYACYMEQYENADKELNAAYQGLRSCYTESDNQTGLKRVREAQRAWITFRDSNCKWEGNDFAGGSEEKVLIASCLARMTDDRYQELFSAKLSCEEMR